MGKLRIVAGSLRGRRLDVPDSESVRPTSDRARESLFNIVGSEVVGARVLDLFAGSGALGFEALSRGAVHVTFLEVDVRVARQIRRTAEAFGVQGQISIVCGDFGTLSIRRRLAGPFDLVLADPPYSGGWALLVPPALLGSVTPDGLLVLEIERGSAIPAPGGWSLARTVSYGRACLLFYRLDRASDEVS